MKLDIFNKTTLQCYVTCPFSESLIKSLKPHKYMGECQIKQPKPCTIHLLILF